MLPLLAVGQVSDIPKNEIRVDINLAKKQFHLGDPIELRVEITNIGLKPLLVPNSLFLYRDKVAYLEIELSNSKGLLSPHMAIAVDNPPNSSKERKCIGEIVLNSFVLLRPGTSYVQRLALGAYLTAFKYELKPGAYKIKSYYSTGGLFYPPAYSRLGLTAKEIESLSFEAWHGKLPTNELSFVILPATAGH